MGAYIKKFSAWIRYDEENEIKSTLGSILKESQFTIINFIEHYFVPSGYTALWLLSESHCALHTFPEDSKAYVELSSCNIEIHTRFVKLFNEKFRSI